MSLAQDPGGSVRTQRFILACDLKVGDSILVSGRPYLITAVEQLSVAVMIASGTWSISLAPDEAVEIHGM